MHRLLCIAAIFLANSGGFSACEQLLALDRAIREVRRTADSGSRSIDPSEACAIVARIAIEPMHRDLLLKAGILRTH
jgi:hypothetical protein